MDRSCRPQRTTSPICFLRRDRNRPRRFSVSIVTSSMDHWKEPLDLEIGDTIIWREATACESVTTRRAWS